MHHLKLEQYFHPLKILKIEPALSMLSSDLALFNFTLRLGSDSADNDIYCSELSNGLNETSCSGPQFCWLLLDNKIVEQPASKLP